MRSLAGKNIYLFGGSTTEGGRSTGVREVEVFDTVRQTWRSEFRLSEDAGEDTDFVLFFCYVLFY